jgi:hypothetical protein
MSDEHMLKIGGQSVLPDEAPEVLEARAACTRRFMAEKGWTQITTLQQVLEIRRQPGWIDPLPHEEDAAEVIVVGRRRIVFEEHGNGWRAHWEHDRKTWAAGTTKEAALGTWLMTWGHEVDVEVVT